MYVLPILNHMIWLARGTGGWQSMYISAIIIQRLISF